MKNKQVTHGRPKPCPCCGNTGIDTEMGYEIRWCQCTGCEMHGPTAMSHDEAVLLWDNLPRTDVLEDWADLMVDEFKRVRNLTENTEIHQLCDRAISNTKQHFPVIEQRDQAERKLAAEHERAEKFMWQVRDTCARAKKRIGELWDALQLILPLAKGYAAANPVGSNQAYVNQVELLLNNMRSDSNKIKEAFDVIGQAMKDDPEYAWSVHCNLAMMAYEAGAPHGPANEKSADLMKRLFGVDTHGMIHDRTKAD